MGLPAFDHDLSIFASVLGSPRYIGAVDPDCFEVHNRLRSLTHSPTRSSVLLHAAQSLHDCLSPVLRVISASLRTFRFVVFKLELFRWISLFSCPLLSHWTTLTHRLHTSDKTYH